MKFKSILLTAAATLSLTTATMAQVPNYVPTNGLVGWWPFNGNANDESGNGSNGVVNGATPTSDRFGLGDSAYSFNGLNNFITLPQGVSNLIPASFTISIWHLSYNDLTSYEGFEVINDRANNSYDFRFRMLYSVDASNPLYDDSLYFENCFFSLNGCNSIVTVKPVANIWHHYIMSFNNNNNTLTAFVNNMLIGVIQNINIPFLLRNLNVGRALSPQYPNGTAFVNGAIDDIGIWNRALTQQEISALFNASTCANNTTITPQINSITTGNTATFTGSTSDPNPSYVWQSNLGQGFQTLNNFGNYSGANTATLNIANVQLSNHTQPIRVITTSGNCIDTSNVAVINIFDTCIVTVYDTMLTTVTDTLVINATITGINPPNNLNTLKVFPNPASTHITIDYGNFNAMSGYTLKIVNSVGQAVFTTPINQQTSYIDLSTWTGNGIYFVQLIDPQNNTIENRKIVIQ